ncbi:MAG: hypothetical protein QM802_23090 [Agriterribacter sp.]
MIKFFTVIFLSLALHVSAQKNPSVDKDKERLDKVCDTFMALFIQGKVHEALQLVKENTVMAPASIDKLQGTVDNQMEQYFPAFGKMLSYEFITEKKIKDFIAKRFYVLKFEQYYLKFGLTLYKSSAGWTITNLKYDEDIVELLN